METEKKDSQSLEVPAETFAVIADKLLTQGVTSKQLLRVLQSERLQRRIANIIVMDDPDSLRENERIINVDYTVKLDKDRLNAEFSRRVSQGLYDVGTRWSLHQACQPVDSTFGPRIMLLKCFERPAQHEANISEMYGMGYRPAVLHEIYAFGMTVPGLELVFDITTLGPRTGDDCIPCLTNEYGSRCFSLRQIGAPWTSETRFLFVRR
jgi:hypothetical protein